MKREELYALKAYIDLRVKFLIDREMGRRLPDHDEYSDLERKFDADMLADQPQVQP